MRNLGIVVLVIVVLGLLWLGYKLIFKKPEDGTPCDSTGSGNIDGTIVDGDCVKTDVPRPGGPNLDQNIEEGVLNIPLQNKLVKSSDVTPASTPSYYFNNIHTSNMGSFNLIVDDKRTRSNPISIRFTAQFNNAFPQFVWYNKWLYSLNQKVGSSSGVDTYYYGVERAALPIEIRITTPNQCSIFKFKVSGVEYRYSDTVIEHPTTLTTVAKCVYKKQ